MFADIEDRRLSLAVVARLVFVRTEAIRLRHAVGGAVLTIANQCNACFVITAFASPEGYASAVASVLQSAWR
ncbi:MAG: hypothetical protein ACRD2A_21340 [Vicinamibacterales bacterium]